MSQEGGCHLQDLRRRQMCFLIFSFLSRNVGRHPRVNVLESPGMHSALNEESEAIQWIDICAACFSLIGVLTIAIKSIIEMKSGGQMNKSLVVLFCVAVCSAVLFLITGILYSIGWLIPSDSLQFYTLILITVFYMVFLFCLLATLIVRLWVVFKDSVWRMSYRIRNTFIVLCTLGVVGDICHIYLFSLTDDQYGASDELYIRNLYLASGGALLLVYATMSALAVYLFVHNLVKLAALQTSRAADAISLKHGARRTLNKQQVKMVGQSTKYLSLFLIAMMSTLISVIPLLAGALLITRVLSRLDVCVNVMCLYLQFRFAKLHYDTCCIKVDGCTRKVIERCVGRKIASQDA